ncbi:hypothetical protein TEA_021145 [Camellia sinensis var. sinensis]|uniref:Pyruvate dehydrogenase E1 component subunit beta n=1 Tax=Camellia sinensis var. sinensis TaxID=542762 RepID=A0A4S4DFA7_CAMSN|nr:hypothetical protein TEA_021145 [Camellia sinensis var. sinensis]
MVAGVSRKISAEYQNRALLFNFLQSIRSKAHGSRALEDEPILPPLKKEQLKNGWDDEDVDENDVKDSWEDEEETALVEEYQGVYKAIDHIINSATKSNYMSASQINVPIVFRGPNGAAVGVGAQHSQIWGESFLISAEVLDSSFCLLIGKAKVEREGKDVTITTFSWMVGYAIKVAEILAKEGISAEVINLHSIRLVDRATTNASVRKTSRLVIVEEGFPQHGVGAEICGKAFTTKGMQVLELVGKETMDLLITETGIEVDKKGAQAQDDEDQFSSSEIDGSATTLEKGKKIETGAEGSANEMKNLHDSSVKKAVEMAAG